MNVLERINTQIRNVQTVRAVGISIPIQETPKKVLSKPIRSYILRKILMETNEISLMATATTALSNVDRVFGGIEEFVDWYVPLQESFSEPQRRALETLVGARNAINGGCGCKRHKRTEMAAAYYSTFWTENAKTDLPKKVLEVANVKSIDFRVGRTQNLVLQVTRP